MVGTIITFGPEVALMVFGAWYLVVLLAIPVGNARSRILRRHYAISGVLTLFSGMLLALRWWPSNSAKELAIGFVLVVLVCAGLRWLGRLRASMA